MTSQSNVQIFDRDELQGLFDLRSPSNAVSGGGFSADPYPTWHALRTAGAVHSGTPHELTGYPGPWIFQGLPCPDQQHFTAFTFEACNSAFRDPETFASSPVGYTIDTEVVDIHNSLFAMGGTQHRRFRALVQQSFVPAKARWWITNWIEHTVHTLIDNFIDEGRADLNIDFAAALPILTITGSFGVDVDDALLVRQSIMNDPMTVVSVLQPIIDARRQKPEDDLISILAGAEFTDEDGVRHRMTDAEINSFALILLAGGSGTTWKQLGITLAALLQRPDLLAAVRNDRDLVQAAVEESLRWMPTDPVFARYVTRDLEFHGVEMPEGSVLHLNMGAANRDPARWHSPDDYDIAREPKQMLTFGNGPHVCLGMHVARAEMAAGINALLDRLPNLRLDSDAPPPEFIGFYERGVTGVHVLFG